MVYWLRCQKILSQSRSTALRAAAEKAINSGQAEQGRRLAQDGLRVIEDAAARDEVLDLVLRAYQALPSFKLPSFSLLRLGRQEVNTTRPQPTEVDPSHQVFSMDCFFGLYDEGVPEFTVARSEISDSTVNKPVPRSPTLPEQTAPITSQSDRDYSLAIYSLRGGLANRAVRFGEQLWKNIPADYVLELAPRDLVDLLYPLPYRESLLNMRRREGSIRDLSCQFRQGRASDGCEWYAAARG